MSSLVLQPRGKYRKIAQENWGLTDEQMVGMHVHHRIPRSKGGTDDPSNLYVCSAWFHSHVWHGDDSYHPLIEWCAEGGRKGGRANKGVPQSPEHRAKLSKAHTGKVLSEEHKAKIAESHKECKPNWKSKGEYPQMRRPRVKCPVCKRDCANSGALALHMKVHFK